MKQLTKDFYIQHLEKCFDRAEAGASKLSPLLLEMTGFTGIKTRHFYNNLLDFEDSRYLEVGTWSGSSVSAAMFNNAAKIICIDNWSEFDGKKAKELFDLRFEYFMGANNATFIESDCFKVDIKNLIKFNVYLFDGCHTYEDHYKALQYYLDSLDDTFIFIVDDWNWEPVRNGTMDAIRDLKLKQIWSKEIRLTHNNEHTPDDVAKATWWNGIAAFVLQKS
ncbi:MAG TPA: class I SAM-dependent methyltransferase [Mucilaginibacter sp.]|jgi:hypothetical protein|nr:class I SAM-dependent methyltransferase [Mucilaginibacter sp.]